MTHRSVKHSLSPSNSSSQPFLFWMRKWTILYKKTKTRRMCAAKGMIKLTNCSTLTKLPNGKLLETTATGIKRIISGKPRPEGFSPEKAQKFLDFYLDTLNANERNKKIIDQQSELIDNYRLLLLSSKQPPLENFTPSTQDACCLDTLSPEKMEEEPMAKQHRLRVIVGYTEDNEPIIKQIAAPSETTLADMAIKAVIKSGRIAEFLPDLVNKLSQTQQPANPLREKTLLKDYIPRWRKTYKQGLSPTTEVFYDAKQSVIISAFGDRFIEDVTPGDVQSFLNERAKKFKKKTIKDDLAFLRMVLASAVQDGIISKNPAKDERIFNPAEEGEETVSLTRAQVIAIQEAIPRLEDARERCLLGLLAYSSMRREELLALRWENIDFQTNTFEIKAALVYPKSKPTFKATKTKSGKRTFPMDIRLREILLSCRKESGLIICDDEGKPFTLYGYQRLWDSLSKHIDLYGMTAINFRTTFATMAIASGVDIRTTQALMGHSDPKMTLKVYTKVEQTRLPAAVNKISSFLTDPQTC